MNAPDTPDAILAKIRAHDRKVVCSLVAAILLLSSLVTYWGVTESARRAEAIAYLAEH